MLPGEGNLRLIPAPGPGIIENLKWRIENCGILQIAICKMRKNVEPARRGNLSVGAVIGPPRIPAGNFPSWLTKTVILKEGHGYGQPHFCNGIATLLSWLCRNPHCADCMDCFRGHTAPFEEDCYGAATETHRILRTVSLILAILFTLCVIYLCFALCESPAVPLPDTTSISVERFAL